MLTPSSAFQPLPRHRCNVVFARQGSTFPRWCLQLRFNLTLGSAKTSFSLNGGQLLRVWSFNCASTSPSAPPSLEKALKTIGFSMISTSALFTVFALLGLPWRPKRHPGTPKGAPRPPQERSKDYTDPPRTPQGHPSALQRCFKVAPSTPEDPQGLSQIPFRTLQGPPRAT